MDHGDHPGLTLLLNALHRLQAFVHQDSFLQQGDEDLDQDEDPNDVHEVSHRPPPGIIWIDNITLSPFFVTSSALTRSSVPGGHPKQSISHLLNRPFGSLEPLG